MTQIFTLSAKAETTGDMQKFINLPSGLRYADDRPGDGAVAAKGQSVTVNYTGWIYENGGKGRKFDSSPLDRHQPFSFNLGGGQVIQGWEQGVAGMKVGGKRTLIIPPDLGYGGKDVGNGLIPPWSTLIFEVDLLQVQ